MMGRATEERHAVTRLQAALKLEEVPPEKWSRMTWRTWVGIGSMLALTLFLLGMSWLHFERSGEPSLWLIGAGVFCGFVTGQIASGQVVGSAVMSLADPLRLVRELFKGKE